MVFIRADANEKIATGHIVRCITIAKELLKQKINVVFLVSDDASTILLEQNGCKYIVLHTMWNYLDTEIEVARVTRILEDSKIKQNRLPVLLVDSYYVDREYFLKLKGYAKLVMIDDLCKEIYDADVVMNFNLSSNLFDYDEKYRGKDTKLLLGTRYVPLREEFQEIPENKKTDDRALAGEEGKLNVMLICGGGDPLNFLHDFLMNAICDVDFGNYVYHVVVGAYNPYIREIDELGEKYSGLNIYHNVTNMAELMGKCDVAVSAAGTVLYECCAMALPTIFFCAAENQEDEIKPFSADGLMLYAGNARINRKKTIENALAQLNMLYKSEELRGEMSNKGKKVTDGKGAIRIAEFLIRELEGK